MRQKANPGLLSVRRTRGLGHRRCHFQTPPTAQQALAPGPKRRSLCGVWVGSRSLRSPGESDVSEHRLCSARRRLIGTRLPESCRDLAARSSDGMRRLREMDPWSHLQSGWVAGLLGAAGRGRCRTRFGSRGHQTPGPGSLGRHTLGLRTPQVGSFLTWRLSPLWPLISALDLLSLITLPHFLWSCYPTVGLQVFPQVPAPLIWSPLAERQEN